jgi:hypothetical protein
MDKNSKFIKSCESCGETSTCFCFECKELFCDSCFKYIHEKKYKQGHQKELIDPFAPFDTKCPDHPLIPITLFCLNEKGKSYILMIFFTFRIMLFQKIKYHF